MSNVELAEERARNEPPGALFIGLFWSVLGTLVSAGTIALVAWAAGAGWRV